MFGLSFSGPLIQGSAERTWNCISQIANLVWYKFNNLGQPIMPRQRRKHHSRSRSRSHSHDKDRDAKRRKIELYDSPNHKRSVSPPIVPTDEENRPNAKDPAYADTSICDKDKTSDSSDIIISLDSDSEISEGHISSTKENEPESADHGVIKSTESNNIGSEKTEMKHSMDSGTSKSDLPTKFQETTPKRLTPKQIEKKLESEKKRQIKEKEREERERQKRLEKEQKESEKQKKKEQKQREIEQKQKEKEEKEEQKRQEKELKLKQKEEEKLRKQQEINEKNKEKIKEEEKKQKAAAAFVSFFVSKKVITSEEKKNEESNSAFMPFEVKCDMKLPPLRREPLTSEEKNILDTLLLNNETKYSYLKDLKSQLRHARSCPRTWINKETDDVIIVEEEILLGQTICEEKPRNEKLRAKLLQFHENQRPAYYGTWRKRSRNITGRTPWGKEDTFDYDVDSDDDWEEEEQGESLDVVSDDEKENEPENDDYEVDNDFFVPHGHLSEDECDDEELAKLSPESQKQKLQLLKDAFDQDIKSKTHKIKPRSIGCVWYNSNGTNVDEAIDRYLHPLKIITNGQIEVKKRQFEMNDGNALKKKKPPKPLPETLMRVLAKLVHGNVKKREKLVVEFLDYIQTNNMGMELSKNNVSKQISNIAKWTWNVENKSHCWIVSEDIADKYKIDFVLPNVQEPDEDNVNETM